MSNKNKESSTQKWYERIIQSKWFVLILSILIVTVDALVQITKKDWIWLVITIVVLCLLLLLIYFLSVIMRKEREDIMQSIIQEDGILNKYLQEKIEYFNGHGTCLEDIQKKCKKRIEQNFFKTEEVIIFDIDEILKIEKDVQNGEIWIISDELGIYIDKDKIFNTIIKNLRDGTVYTYFHTKSNLDAISRIKRKLESKGITNIDSKVSFTQVSDRYDALLTITKDIIILNPDGDNRISFICIYSNNNFDIAFYRKLDAKEIELLCNIIISSNMLKNVVSSEVIIAYRKLANRLDGILKKSNVKVDPQTQYFEELNQTPEILNKYIAGKRSGELEKPNYYAALQSAANSIIKEKRETEVRCYKGEIWALSLCLSNEWNEEDEYEKKWLDTLLQMDEQGIKTSRLYIFNDETLGLNPFEDKGKILLAQLDIYCSKTTFYKHTQSYAISKREIEVSDDAEFERGFFALTLKDERTFLIYDVAGEKINIANEPCGEIDYDNERKKNIRNKLEIYLKKAKPLNQYLQEKSSKEAIAYMKSHNFNIDVENESS